MQPPTEGESTVDHLSVCRCCGALCGIVVTTRGEDVVAVRGDRGHPVSRGYVCPKGRALPAFHHRADRLEHPRLHGRPASWETVLDDLAERLRRLLDDHGPDSIGAYTSTGQYFDSAALFAEERFYGALGTRQRYTAATVDCAPTWRAAELVTGFAKPFHPVWTPEDPEPSLVVMIGFNPVVSHVYFGARLADPVRRIRQFRSGGGEVWVIDPRRTETAALADRHLAPRPGTDAYVLAWLVREILTEGADRHELATACDPAEVDALTRSLAPFDTALVTSRSGVTVAELEDLAAAIRQRGKLAAISGTGVTFGRFGLLTEWLRWALLIVTGSLDRPGGMRFNPGDTVALEAIEWAGHAPPTGWHEPGPPSRPDLRGWLGEYPCAAMVDEIEAGNLRGLFVAGGSPLTAFPDPDRTRAAIDRLSFLAVFDVVANELVEMATHVLPVAGQLERSDLLRSYAPRVVPPLADRRPAWWILSELGRRLGIDVLDGVPDDDQAGEAILWRLASRSRAGAEAALEAGPRGIAPPDLRGWVRERVLPGGRWRLAPPMMVERLTGLVEVETASLALVSHRVVHSHNSVRYPSPDRSGATPVVRLHPDDAATRGLRDGDEVELSSRAGQVRAAVAVDPRMRQGAVALTHGWLEPNVARLVDGHREVDPMTGQPVQTGVPVELSRVGRGR